VKTRTSIRAIHSANPDAALALLQKADAYSPVYPALTGSLLPSQLAQISPLSQIQAYIPCCLHRNFKRLPTTQAGN
jgi:hypothetical protein